MMVDPSVATEAILFFDRNGVSKEMTYSEFEAVLDGVVGLSDVAGDKVPAAYVLVDGQLKVNACVLFKIGFDRQGYADKSWNIPLRHLADTAGRGPDMGAGPIRLACKSQCSVNWHEAQLWDPIMTPDNNTFVRMRDAVANNRLCLPTSGPVESIAKVSAASENQWTMGEEPAPAAKPARKKQTRQPPVIEAPPVLSSDDDIESDDYMDDFAHYDEQDMGLTESQLEALESAHRKKIASLIRQQRLHIKTMQTDHQQQMAKMKLGYEKKIQQQEIEVARLTNQHESLHSQNIALREQNEAQRRQLEAFKRTRDLELQKAEAHEKQQVDGLRAQYEELMAQRIAEETAKLREDIELRNMELIHRHEVAKKLREELCELRRDKLRLVNEGGDKFLDKLEALGVSFIAFHPGAGHISITLKDMGTYMENPIGFAADRCLVSEEHYRTWLDHYNNPTCQAPLTKDKVCGCKIRRTDVPSQFVLGEHDRCEKHKAHRSGENVVNLRS
ncbi:MAG: hypothetical protein MI867_06570 [Pseudomonadales bacterium]|nr:hypothetical protein [Pseudomonadales bacterium]